MRAVGDGMPGPCARRRPAVLEMTAMAIGSVDEDVLGELPAHLRLIAERNLALRERARLVAAVTGVDEGDAFHLLQQLARPPAERLRVGLAHGRLRPRVTD